jgi:hypothetical protein
MAEKKKDKNIYYLLLGLGVVGGLYFFTKKKGETVDEVEKPTSDLGNGKNDKTDVKKDDLGQPKVQPTLPFDPVNTGVVQPTEPTIDIVTTSASSGKKSSPIVETVDFTV